MIIDAIVTGKHPAGTVYRFVQTENDEPVRLSSSHQIDLGQVVALAKLLGADVPQTLTVYAVEAGDVGTFHERCTEAVSNAIPRLVEAVCRDVEEGVQTPGCCPGEWQILYDAVPV
jgi:hydrogenase maturation protease